MKILLINHYAGSPMHGMEYRPYYLAREWVRSGNKVKIVAASVSHLRANAPVVVGKVASEEVDSIDYVWVKTPGYSGNGLTRVLNLLSFAKSIYLNRGEILDGFVPELVIASSPHPFIIRAAKKISDQSRAKLIFEVRDLWPLSLVELGGMHPMHPFIAFMQHEEDYAYKHSDKIASLLPLAEDYMIGRGMHEGKFFFAPNGIVVADGGSALALPEKVAEKIKRFKLKYRLLVGFAGSHGIANALDSLIDAAGLVQNEKAIGFVLIGKGDERLRLINKARDMELENVLFLDEIEKAMVPSFLDSMDILYIGLKNHPLFRFGVSPNKLFDYMMSAKPIIYSIGSGNDPVGDAKCGVSCEPENPKAVVQAIIKLIEMPEESRLAMGMAGRDYVQKHHDYSVLARDYLKAIQ